MVAPTIRDLKNLFVQLFDKAHIPGNFLTYLKIVIRYDHPFRDPEMSQSALEVDGYASVMDFHDNTFHSDYFVTVFHISL